MIEEFLQQGLGSLLTQGTGWILFVLSLIVIWWMDRRQTECQKARDEETKEAEKAVLEQYEKRLAEFAEILNALNRNTTAINGFETTVGARTEAINQLVVGFASLVRDINNNRERWHERGAALMKGIEDVQRRLEALQSHARAG